MHVVPRAAAGGGRLRAHGLSCLLLGCLIAITGGTESRQVTTDARALLGAGPDPEVPGCLAPLGAVETFLFVSVPLLVLGSVLLDASR